MEVTELIVKSEIIQPLELNYNKEEIERFIVALEENYKGVIVSESEIFQAKETISKINKIIATLKNYRIDNTKRAMRPLDSFINDFKSYEKRLELVYRETKNQIDTFDLNVLNMQLEIMKNIKETLCEEQKIEKELWQFIELPEQKNELSKSKFNEKKATELIQVNIDKIVGYYNVIKTNIERVNARSDISLNAKDYICYIEDINQAIERITIDENRCVELKEKVKNEISQNEAKFEQNEAETINKSSDENKCKSEANLELKTDNGDKVIKLLITLSQKEIKKAKLLRNFLEENEINYTKI